MSAQYLTGRTDRALRRKRGYQHAGQASHSHTARLAGGLEAQRELARERHHLDDRELAAPERGEGWVRAGP